MANKNDNKQTSDWEDYEDQQSLSHSSASDSDSKNIEIINNRSGKQTLPSLKLKGIDNLDLSFAANSKDREIYNIQEDSVNVIFDLPDGSQGENLFKLGHTVEFLKSFIECEYGIPMADQSLFIDNKPMYDPFSLLDYPEAKGTDELYVKVEGNIPTTSRK
jgi:hypothetical protein